MNPKGKRGGDGRVCSRKKRSLGEGGGEKDLEKRSVIAGGAG